MTYDVLLLIYNYDRILRNSNQNTYVLSFILNRRLQMTAIVLQVSVC